nr:PREDICTED: disintegrin and metalloproteinase domain-containing protein 2-like [Bos indicus]
MLCLLFLLLGLTGLQTDDNSERLRVQFTVPEKIRSTSSGGVETHVSYIILIEGKTYTVNLMQKAFLPHNFRVYGYSGTGSMKPLEHEFQNFCYYQGYIEGYPNSMAIISTCTGLRGLLQFENVSYGIEPLEPSIGFEHMVYQIKPRDSSSSVYTEREIELREKPYKIQNVEPLPDFSQYIEMHIVVEKDLYNHMGADTTVVIQKIFQLTGLTNAIFTSLNITVILSSLELWIDENKIPVTGDANELLHRFVKWKRSYLVLRPHDMAFLLVYREKSNYIGATFQGRMCDKHYGGGVALHSSTISLESLAVIIAQLLSLSMGIPYDDINKCHCPGDVCIMNPAAVHSSGVKLFSNCSVEDFLRFISKPKSQCLQNQPRLDPTYKSAVCGNGKVEEGEQCDCGNKKACDALPDTCCVADTCRFQPGSACDTGLCCESCAFIPKGHICRGSTDECDLHEYCNGSSAACQEDVYVQDGHPCGQNQWLCISGICVDGIKQCFDIFGEGTSYAPAECFQRLNSMNDLSGNCGVTPTGFTPCTSEDLPGVSWEENGLQDWKDERGDSSTKEGGGTWAPLPPLLRALRSLPRHNPEAAVPILTPSGLPPEKATLTTEPCRESPWNFSVTGHKTRYPPCPRSPSLWSPHLKLGLSGLSSGSQPSPLGGRQSPVSPPPFPLAAVALALLPPGRSELDVVPLITLGTQALTLTGDYGLVTESGLQAPGRLSSGQAS